MSVTLTLASVVAALNPFRTPDDPTPAGAEAVRIAIDETEALYQQQYAAVLGEPEMRDFGGYFQTDWKVVIPVHVDENIGSSSLIFELPRGWDDPESLLLDLLDSLDLTLNSLEDLEGEVVPVEFYGGNPTVMWETINSDDGVDGGIDHQEVETDATEE